MDEDPADLPGDQPAVGDGPADPGPTPSKAADSAHSSVADPEPSAEEILGRMTDAFFAVDDDWQLTYVNEQARPILEAATGGRVDGENLVGHNLWEAIPDAVDTTFYEQYHDAMETLEPVHFEEYFDPLETWFDVRAYPSETGISVYFQDVTDRIEREQLLANRDRVIRRVHDITADPDLEFGEKVDALLELGCDALGTDMGNLSHVSGDAYHFEYVRAPDGELEAGATVDLGGTNCERAISEKQTLVLADLANQAPDLAERASNQDLGLACYLGAPVVVDDKVDGTFCFYDTESRDSFTDWEVALVDLMAQWIGSERTRQLTYDRLVRQNEQLEEFTSIVSHDLRNPLTVLDSSLDLARESGDEEHFARCERAIDRMEALVENLLTLAQAGDELGDMSQVDLAEKARDCWHVVSTSKASLAVETEAVVQADDTRLHQLFENLFRNAVEHGGDGVTITVGDIEDGFFVADDGPGIPPADRDRVREAGYSSDAAGTGYGLNIVDNIVAAHGWSMRITESESGGARFEIYDVGR